MFITNKHWHGVMQKSLKTKEGTDIEGMECDNIVQDKVPAEVFLKLLHLDMLCDRNNILSDSRFVTKLNFVPL